MRNSALIADTISRWCVIALTALLPVFFIPLTCVTIAQAKTILVALLVVIAMAAWVWGRIVERTFTFRKSPLLLAGLLLPVAYIVSALTSGREAASFVSGTGVQDTVAVISMLYAI